jgi:hypothetical protein
MNFPTDSMTLISYSMVHALMPLEYLYKGWGRSNMLNACTSHANDLTVRKEKLKQKFL